MCEVCITSSSRGFRLGVRERSEPFFPWFSKEKKSLLASAAVASAAAAAAAVAAAATALRTAGWSCSAYYFVF